MRYQSARQFLGKPVLDHASESMYGLIESITIDPQLMMIDGFLIGRGGKQKGQDFLPRECIVQDAVHHLIAQRTTRKPPISSRILGLSAWTIKPKFLAGFVYDCYFCLEDGSIESFVIHQLLRTWRIPATAVEKITPKALLINNDMTIKLKLTPYQTLN